MKLEEVLPAMREGRVAKSAHGTRFMIERGDLRFWDYVNRKWTHAHADTLLLDGWTLEPEPKVEWPKGSVQWACEEAVKQGRNTPYLQHRNAQGFLTASRIDANRVTEYLQVCPSTLGSLGWEVVP